MNSSLNQILLSLFLMVLGAVSSAESRPVELNPAADPNLKKNHGRSSQEASLKTEEPIFKAGQSLGVILQKTLQESDKRFPSSYQKKHLNP